MKDDDIINSMIDYGDDDGAAPSGDTQVIPTAEQKAAETEKAVSDSAKAAADEEEIEYTQVIDSKQVLEMFEADKRQDESAEEEDKAEAQTQQAQQTQKIRLVSEDEAETADGATRIISLAENSDTECFSGDEGEDEPDGEVLAARAKQAQKSGAADADEADEETEAPVKRRKFKLNFKYDDYSDYDDYEGSPVMPLILAALKLALPILAVVIVVIVVLTSQNSAVTRYRNNFSANTNRLLDDMGINIHKQQPIQKGEPQEQGAGAAAVPEGAAKTADDEITGEEIELKEKESEYKTFVSSSVTVPFTGTEEASFVKHNDAIIGAKTNYICCIGTDGTLLWEKSIILTDPVVKAEGEYILAYQDGGKRFLLLRNDEEVFVKNTDDNILSANVSANGDVVLVTDKPAYKGAVVVYNKQGNKAFSWSSGSADVLAADISDNSRRVAAALLHTDDKVSSSVYMFDINKTEPYAKTDFSDSVVYRLEFKGNRLTAFSDNMLTGMSDGGKVKFNIGFEDVELITCGMDDNGNHAALFTQDNIPMINVYNKNGNLSSSIPVLRMPDYMAAEHGNVIYNVDRDIILGKPDAKKPYKYTAAMDIRGLIPINNSSFMVIYSNGVELVKMGGGLF